MLFFTVVLSLSIISCDKKNKRRDRRENITSGVPTDSGLSTDTGIPKDIDPPNSNASNKDLSTSISKEKKKTLLGKLTIAALNQNTKEIEKLYKEIEKLYDNDNDNDKEKLKSETFNQSILINLFRSNKYKSFDCYIKFLHSKLKQKQFSKLMWSMINILNKKEIISIIDKSKCFKDYLDQDMIEYLFVYTLRNYVKWKKNVSGIDGTDITMLVSRLGGITINNIKSNEGKIDIIKDIFFKEIYYKNNSVKGADRDIVGDDFKDCENVHDILIKHSKDYLDFVNDIDQNNGKIRSYSNVKTIRDRIKESLDAHGSGKIKVDYSEFNKISDSLDEITKKLNKSKDKSASDNIETIKASLNAVAEGLGSAIQKRGINSSEKTKDTEIQELFLNFIIPHSTNLISRIFRRIKTDISIINPSPFQLLLSGYNQAPTKALDCKEIINNYKLLTNAFKDVFAIIDISNKNLDSWLNGVYEYEKKCLHNEIKKLKMFVIDSLKSLKTMPDIDPSNDFKELMNKLSSGANPETSAKKTS